MTKTVKIIDNYFIDKYSNVYSSKRKKIVILKQSIINGYKSVSLCVKGKSKKKRVHRLLAEAFIPNKGNKPCVNHKDGVKINNAINNLEWCTHKENSMHASKNGMIKSGEKSVLHKIKDSEVEYIRESSLKQRELAIKFNVSQPLVSRIINNKRRSC